MPEGLMSVTETGAPAASSSIRSASVKPLTACFEALYMPWIGMARSDTVLPTLMSAPPPAARGVDLVGDLPQRLVVTRRQHHARAPARGGPRRRQPDA